MVIVLLIYFLLASTFVIGKLALAYGQPIFLVGVRMILAGIVLLGYIYTQKPDKVVYKKEDRSLFLQIIFFHIFLSFVLEFWTYRYVTASKCALMFNLSPFITALFAYFFLRQKISRRQLIGLIIGFAGSLPILVGKAPAEEMAIGSVAWLSIPEIALLIAVVAGVQGWIAMRSLVVDKHYSPVWVNGIGMLFGGCAALITSLLIESRPLLQTPGSYPTDITLPGAPLMAATFYDTAVFLGYVLLLILVSNIIFYNAYGALLKKYTPTFLSLVGLLQPLFTAIIAWFILGEQVTWHFFVSLALVSLGAYIYYLDEINQEKKNPVPEIQGS